MKNHTVRFLFVTILSFVLFFSNIALACTPPLPPGWFISKISIDTSTLPTGVKFIENSSGYYKQELVNTTAIPFYFLRQEWPYTHKSINTSGKPTELPEGEIPLYKIVSNNAYYWDSEKGWEKNSIGTSTDSHIGIDLETMGIKIIDNKYNYNRPKDVVIPAPQDFAFKAYYGPKPIEVVGKIDFALNPHYDEQQKEATQGMAICNSWGSIPSTNSVAPILIIGLTILIIPILSYIFIRKTTQDTKKRVVRVVVVTILTLTILYFLARGAGIFY